MMMRTKRTATESPSCCWNGGGGGGGQNMQQPQRVENGVVFNGMARNQYPCPYLYPFQYRYRYQRQEEGFVAEQSTNFSSGRNYNLASSPRPRLQWTHELHDQFVKAVNELGGPTKATPKAILSSMDVPGLALYQVKSHLQKFRLGKIVRLSKKPFVPADYRSGKDAEILPSVTLEGQGSSIPNSSHSNGLLHGSGIQEPYENRNQLIELQTTVENLETAEKTSGVRITEQEGSSVVTNAATCEEAFASATPAISPFFPPIQNVEIGFPSCHFPEWFELLDGGREETTVHKTIENVSMDDYLSSVGYSTEFALDKVHESGRASTRFGSFFDDVASFSNVDGGVLTPDENISVVAASSMSSRFMSDFP